jgi:hypothetical protein
MGTPARKGVLDNVATTLAGITAGNGYKTTVATVERCIKDWDSVGVQSMPWLGFGPGVERYTHEPGGMLLTELDINIVGHLNEATAENRTTKLSALVDDVIAVLSVDTTRDANAIQTTIAESEADDGDPDNNDSRGGTGSCRVLVRVKYQRTTGKS